MPPPSLQLGKVVVFVSLMEKRSGNSTSSCVHILSGKNSKPNTVIPADKSGLIRQNKKCVSDHMGLPRWYVRIFFLQYFVIVPRDFSSKIRKLSIFELILDQFCLQSLITSLKVVRFTSFFSLYDPQ